MVSLRAKDSKAKKQGDFTKKKRKVGKIVKRSNVTKIVVKSKQIRIPAQSSVNDSVLSEKAQLDKLLRNIQHYSANVKISALEEFKPYFQNLNKKSSSVSSSYVALLMPSLLELLYDEDMDTRKALKSAIVNVLKSCASVTLLPIATLVVTYVCSGLTSLHKVFYMN